MRHVLITTVVIAVMIACHGQAGAPAPAGLPPAADSVPARTHDPVSIALGLKPLRATVLGPDERELRLSTGPGMIFGAEYAVAARPRDARRSGGRGLVVPRRSRTRQHGESVGATRPTPVGDRCSVAARATGLVELGLSLRGAERPRVG